MNEDKLLVLCKQKGIKFGQDEEPDVESYRAALLNYVAETKATSKSLAQELVMDTLLSQQL